MNILIRPLTIDDAEISYKWRNDPEIWKFTENRPNKEITWKIEKEWLKNTLADKSNARFAIIVDNVYVGNVQLTEITPSQSAQFHIFLGEKFFWGRGVARQATYQILVYAREILNLNYVFLKVNKHHLSAIELYKNNGFKVMDEVDDFITMKHYLKDLHPPMVSVFCMVYNHEKYIAQAIEGFLMQRTSFNSIMVIGEDCSNDGSRRIILDYVKKYPGKFKILLSHKNLGAHNNQELVLKNCTGKYVAMCEGDDCWTDPLKLQKQVDFMETNRDYSGVGTNSEVIYEYSTRSRHLFKDYKERTLGINDFLMSRPFHTATFLFKKDIYKEDFPKNILSADRALFMLTACYGKIKLLSDVTAVYRRNETGLSRSVKSNQMMKDYAIAKYILKYTNDLDYYRAQSFVAYTVFAYSQEIYFFDFIKNSYLLLYYKLKRDSSLSYRYVFYNNFKLIYRSFKKVKFG
ncbi:GNAT family N-acetyltransferase [Mesoflavibacter zeaxanthinifaciens]|uniref:GNAT family N-acetyltransferase n=1 Tax=Mesoflavibacter zeaxanthinifaciens TaxID=393060 RepID=UPI003A8CF514